MKIIKMQVGETLHEFKTTQERDAFVNKIMRDPDLIFTAKPQRVKRDIWSRLVSFFRGQ
jgi:hypothetical protein